MPESADIEQAIEEIDTSRAIKLKLNAGQFSMHHERLVHGSDPNNSNDRRLGMSFTYLPTRVKCDLPDRTAILVRGKDEYGYWKYDPVPRHDLDPVCMEVMRYWIQGYSDPTITQESKRAG